MLLRRDGDSWIGTVSEGAVYGLVADGDGARFDPSKVLLDPQALEVWFSPDHDRWLAAERGASNAGRGPMAVARRTPRGPSIPPIVATARRLRAARAGHDDAGRRAASRHVRERSSSSCRGWPRSASR